ncbi:beta-ketoacyl-ACP synthase I [Trifolium pratense]|uniref:beta-ketoacyl-[acyl-carrier-protein] synthase I n=1 Tax=Trifolium pratense TaxID=57577 RepID=A0A2K3MWR8_TRIPR|nr:beta-ketoacyl-ACP synthase I [Trifolium pratense]
MKRGAPIIAEYLGGAVNCDAYHMTDPRSDGLGVSTCIQSSLVDAGVSPEEHLEYKVKLHGVSILRVCGKWVEFFGQSWIINGRRGKRKGKKDMTCERIGETQAYQIPSASCIPFTVNYINAHATSTLAGDLAEINAIKKVFKNTSGIKINATKSMIGHCLGAAGGLEAIATVKAITTGWVHPSINQFNPEPAVDFDTVPNVKQQHEINVGISNSFGFGGHNSVVAFSAFRP